MADNAPELLSVAAEPSSDSKPLLMKAKSRKDELEEDLEQAYEAMDVAAEALVEASHDPDFDPVERSKLEEAVMTAHGDLGKASRSLSAWSMVSGEAPSEMSEDVAGYLLGCELEDSPVAPPQMAPTLEAWGDGSARSSVKSGKSIKGQHFKIDIQPEWPAADPEETTNGSDKNWILIAAAAGVGILVIMLILYKVFWSSPDQPTVD